MLKLRMCEKRVIGGRRRGTPAHRGRGLGGWQRTDRGTTTHMLKWELPVISKFSAWPDPPPIVCNTFIHNSSWVCLEVGSVVRSSLDKSSAVKSVWGHEVMRSGTHRIVLSAGRHSQVAQQGQQQNLENNRTVEQEVQHIIDQNRLEGSNRT